MDNNETIELPRLKEQIDSFVESRGLTSNELPEPIFSEEKTAILPNFSDAQKMDPDFLSVPMVTSIHPIFVDPDKEEEYEQEALSSAFAKIIGTIIFLIIVALIFYFVAKKYLVLTINFNDLIK